jgi:hypothetical protein
MPIGVTPSQPNCAQIMIYSLSAQLAELKAAKCAKIFQEKISGAPVPTASS